MPPRSVLANVDHAVITLTGTSPLVMDNITHAVDPDDPIKREIDKITDKKSNMTEEDRRRKDRLAYIGSLYLEDGRLVVPWAMVRRALGTGAYYIGSASLSGKVDKGVSCTVVSSPLVYDGPEPDQLYEDPKFGLRAIVNKTPTGAKKSMVLTIRPMFPQWSASFPLTILNDIVGFDDVIRGLQAAGATVGVGNARKLGYGRFAVQAEKTEPGTA